LVIAEQSRNRTRLMQHATCVSLNTKIVRVQLDTSKMEVNNILSSLFDYNVIVTFFLLF